MTVATSDELTTKKTAAATRMPGRSPGTKWTASPERGTPVSRSSTSALAVTEIAYWQLLNSSLTGGLRRTTSAAKLAPPNAATAQAGPATSSVANANVPDVVTSPSTPRVTTLRGIISPAKAQTEKSATSAVSIRPRWSPSRAKTAAMHANPTQITRVTYAVKGGSLSAR